MKHNKRNSRFSLALHALSHMAEEPDRMHKSADIADHAGTNPVVVRRVLGHLRKASLLISEKGHAGGWRLARPPQEITLADVYLALNERLFATETSPEHHSCAVEEVLYGHVAALMDEIEQTLLGRLSETTIAAIPR